MGINLNTPKPQFQDSLRSKVVRTALEEIDAGANNLQSQIDALSTASSGNETVNARDSFDVLRDRLRSGFSGLGNVVIDGGTVDAQGTPDLTMQVGAVEAVVDGVGVNLGVDRSWTRSSTTITITEASHTFSNGDIIHVEKTSSALALPLADYVVANVTTDTFDITGVDNGDTSGTLSFGRDTGSLSGDIPTNERIAVVTVNSDATISVILGSDLADPVLPSMAISNRPLAFVYLTSSTTSISNSDIVDCKTQGCLISDNLATTKWFWKIQDAIDAIDSGVVDVFAGSYYEKVDLSGRSDIELNMSNSTIINRVDDSSQCIYIVNTLGNEEQNIIINGGQLEGNSKAGAGTLLQVEYTDNFEINSVYFGDNSSSTITFKSAGITECDTFHLSGRDIGDAVVKIGITDCFQYSVNVVGTKSLFSRPLRTLFNVSIQENAVFDLLEDDIPDVGDIIPVNGGIGDSSGIFIVSHIERKATNSISFYGQRASGSGVGTPTEIVIPETGTGNISASISWN